MRSYSKILCTSLIALSTSAPAHASNQDMLKLINLQIEELQTISVASKKDETIREAPSVISLITKEDIQRYGATNLPDIFNRIPSLQMYATIFPNNAMSIRGQSNQHYPNRILFLINGRPFRESWGGGFNMPLLLEFPISAIQQIETIRGPGSVLYGSNAFSGVINIITKSEKDNDDTTEISATYGSFGRKDIEGYTSHSGEDWSISTGIKRSQSDGWNFKLTDEAGTSSNYDLEENGHGIFINAHYDDLTLNLFQGRSQEKYMSSSFLFSAGPLNINRTFADIGYAFNLGDISDIKLNITHNNFEADKGNKNVSPSDNTSGDTIFEVSSQSTLTDDLDLLFGLSYEMQDGEILDIDYQTQWYGSYAQLDFEPTDWLKLTGGLQLNKPNNVKKDISPRLAAITHLDKNWTAKLLYGQAFRSAYALETSLNLPPLLVGNSTLKPEKIATYEAQLMYMSAKHNASITAYRSRITDIIGRTPIPGGLKFDNLGEETYEGLEFEGKTKLNQHWILEGSALLQRNENSVGRDNVNFTPNIMAKLGLSYQSQNGWHAGIYDSFFGAPEDVRAANPSVNEVNPQPESYHLVSGQMTLDIPTLLDQKGQMPDMKFTLYGENLLNEDIHYAEQNRRVINSIPIEGGRAIYGRISVEF